MKYFYCIPLLLLSISNSIFSQSIEQIISGNNQFTFDIFKETFELDENTFLSPYNISSALAITYAGSRNETEKQISEVLHFDLKQVNTHKGFSSINSDLLEIGNNSSIQLSIANAIWKDKDGSFKQEFLDLTKKYYESSIFDISDAATINNWVKDKTQNKIDNIISENALANLKMVITSAIYFKGDWLNSFKKSDTKTDIFLSTDNIEVEMMHQYNSFNYYEDTNKQAIELQYVEKSMSMIIILPKANNELNSIIESMNETSFMKIINGFNRTKVDVYLPKFSFKSSYQLKDILSNMGMPDAFNSKADFSGMSNDLKIDKIMQKTFIEVTEEGSEAAAATVIAISSISKGNNTEKPQIFKANRPYLFLIKDNKTNSILFIGSVINPLLN